MRHLRRSNTRLLLALLAALGASCAGAAPDARVALREFAGDQVIELVLVSSSFVERTEPEVVAPEEFDLGGTTQQIDLPTETDFYSQQRATASIKVASDAQMRQLLNDLNGSGFGSRAVDGRGPLRAEQGYRKSIEVETPEGVRHFSIAANAGTEDQLKLLEMGRSIRGLFNSIFALQAVDPRPVEEVFEQPQLPERLRN